MKVWGNIGTFGVVESIQRVAWLYIRVLRYPNQHNYRIDTIMTLSELNLDNGSTVSLFSNFGVSSGDGYR